MKRAHRKQLKEDGFASAMNRVYDWSRENTRVIGVGVAALIFILLVTVGYQLIRAQSLKKQSRIVGEIFQIYGELAENPEKVQELGSLAGNGKYSRLAYIQLASYWMENGELEKARENLEKLSGKEKDLIYYKGRDLLAQVCVSQKDYDRALAIYTEIEEMKPAEFPLDVVLFHKADVHEKKGEIEKARSLYEKIKEDYAETYYGFEASAKAEALKRKK